MKKDEYLKPSVSIPYGEGHAKIARLLARQVAAELIAEHQAKLNERTASIDSDKEADDE